ncbi:target of rapamycin [Actinidia rufa]|uniref:Target of rapamycin n=1 Tax=Actinidia rufa TaxID=165716 RepID=A0A7J0EV25_9ERIC|nr:target of rapamycin [Actinidia rufa]
MHHGDVAGVMGVGEFQGWDAEEKGLVSSFIMHFVDDVAIAEYKIFSKCAEFMEHDERPLPIDIRLLGALVEKAVVGILTYAQQHLDVQLKESWCEKLQRWDDAIKAYTAKASQGSSPHLVLDATLVCPYGSANRNLNNLG